jgi:hypothetical protein
MRCIACGCTDARACAGGCSWVSVNPPKCSACFDVDGEAFAVGAEDDGLFGVEHCPASETPAPHMPLFTSENEWHCVRCQQGFFS